MKKKEELFQVLTTKKGFILGKHAISYPYPIVVRISPSGIDKVEEIRDFFISFLKDSQYEETRRLYEQFEAIQDDNARLEHLQWIINVRPDAFRELSKLRNSFA